METFIQPKITGYRQLSASDAELMNRIKAQGQALGEIIVELRNLDIYGIDQRWVSIGETHLQQGIMALVRSVARPESF